jgi:hypothetical protein
MDLTPTIQEIQAAGCESLRDNAAGLEEPIPPLTDREIPDQSSGTSNSAPRVKFHPLAGLASDNP